jgi:hypothetical protein
VPPTSEHDVKVWAWPSLPAAAFWLKLHDADHLGDHPRQMQLANKLLPDPILKLWPAAGLLQLI